MAEYTGWRNFWWLYAAMHAFIFICCLFLFPETKWHRLHPNEIRARDVMQTKLSSNQASNEKIGSDDIGDKGLENVTTMNSLDRTATAARDPWLHRGKPGKQQFKLFQSNPHPFKSIALDLWIPWKLFAFPIVEFASFVVSWSASSFLTINLTQSEVFAAPPYNFSSDQVGYLNFAIVVGAAIGLATAGPLSDWVSMRATKRNNGIREPEMRLPTMIPYVLIMILGNFIVAFGYQQHWDWRVSFLFRFSQVHSNILLTSPF
jgi:hypothetical protein